MTASDCIPADELALLIGGEAGRRTRKRWMPHLDECLDCRTVLADAASYMEESSALQEPVGVAGTFFAWARRPVLAPAIALLLVAVFAIAIFDPLDWRASTPSLAHISSGAVTATLFARPDTALTDARWRYEERGLGFGPSLTERQRSFRAGVYLVDSRVAVHEARSDEARAVFHELQPLVGIELPFGSPLSAAALDGVESDARRALDTVFFALGAWTEAARLAAHAGNAAFFQSRNFHSDLETFLERELPAPIQQRLLTIQELTRELEPTRISRLERELRQLILLN